MERGQAGLVSPAAEVLVLEGETVATIRALAARGVDSKRIAETVGVARNTVRRYLRRRIGEAVQVRPQARRLSGAAVDTARALYSGAADGNAVVVQRLLAEQGVAVSVRTVERAVADLRRAQRVAEVATVRVETARRCSTVPRQAPSPGPWKVARAASNRSSCHTPTVISLPWLACRDRRSRRLRSGLRRETMGETSALCVLDPLPQPPGHRSNGPVVM
jgi:predicted transcriptional regulator